MKLYYVRRIYREQPTKGTIDGRLARPVLAEHQQIAAVVAKAKDTRTDGGKGSKIRDLDFLYPWGPPSPVKDQLEQR
ncbi:hypothetical protein X748_24155 [Mesorhizobium sp. LNJC386A00]|nr:hypothetical protein X748_24155 [Mesorhizobium sp. LNJC386A00]